MSLSLPARQGACHAVLLTSTRTRGSLRPHDAARRTRRFSRKHYNQIPTAKPPRDRRKSRRYFDGIANRHCDWVMAILYHEVARASRAPVLNIRRHYHPFQCLADLMTIMRSRPAICARRALWSHGHTLRLTEADLCTQSSSCKSPLRHGGNPGLPARVQADARNRRRSQGASQAVWHII